MMAVTREILVKSLLCKSGISDYCVNCYTGCLHGCVYCYARFMKRFSGHEEPWGQFLDIKVNAPNVLAKEVRRHKSSLFDQPIRVFMSSVCDGWQPAEKRYKLSRQCLQILADAGFSVGVLTKSALITRDFDILRASPACDLGCTLTTLDESLRLVIEPAASPTRERIAALERAVEEGIRAWAFLGPFMPGLSDTSEALTVLIRAVATVPVEFIYVDKINPRPGVWNSVVQFLHRRHPELMPMYRQLFCDALAYEEYCAELGGRIRAIASAEGVLEKLRMGF